MIQNIQISGMTCSACEAKIKYLFEQHPFVFEAKANHQNNEVVLQVSSELSDSDIEKIINIIRINYPLSYLGQEGQYLSYQGLIGNNLTRRLKVDLHN